MKYGKRHTSKLPNKFISKNCFLSCSPIGSGISTDPSSVARRLELLLLLACPGVLTSDLRSWPSGLEDSVEVGEELKSTAKCDGDNREVAIGLLVLGLFKDLLVWLGESLEFEGVGDMETSIRCVGEGPRSLSNGRAGSSDDADPEGD